MTTRSAAEYALAGREPASVLAPDTAADVAGVLVEAAAGRRAVTPWGGGTLQGLGRPPERYDLALSLTRLDRVIEYAPADMTVRVEAGIRLADLQRVLARQGQYVALEAPLPERATIGGVLAADAALGPRRLGYGERRDQVIGMGVAHPDGTISYSGGSVVKNVTGYDMGKLYTGSLGTLGVIVEATFRLRPLPATSRTLVARFESRTAALQAVRAAGRPPLQPVALDLLSRDPGGAAGALWTVAVEYAGGGAAVARQVKDAQAAAAGADDLEVLEPEEAAAFWATVRDFGRDTSPPDLVVRVMALPARLAELLDAVAQAAEAAGLPAPSVIARAANGVVYAHWPSPAGGPAWAGLVATLRARAAHWRGSVVVEDAPDGLRGALDPWGPPPESFPIMQRFKKEFDPHRVLNPGRFVGGL